MKYFIFITNDQNSKNKYNIDRIHTTCLKILVILLKLLIIIAQNTTFIFKKNKPTAFDIIMKLKIRLDKPN